MARTVSLSTLRSDVRAKGDFGGATVRHTDAQLTRLINQSIQSFRERISDEGSQHYLVSSTGTLGVGPTGDYQFYQLDLSGLSPALVRSYGIDVNINGDIISLEHVPFEQRSKYGSRQSGQPLAWAHFRTDQAAIMPPSNSAYTYIVWYLPKLADLSADGDTFDGVAGWEDFIVWDVVCQLIARDQFPQAYQIAEQRRQEVWQNVIRGATKVTQAGGAHTGRDSFGAKLPHFLGSRHPSVAAAGGPVIPASGSVTNDMLASMTGPTVKGVMSGTARPGDVGVATLTTYLGLFNTTQRGLVPPPLSVGSLFLRDDGTWASAAGAGAAAGASGAVQFQGGAGAFGNASGFAVIGTHPSLIARLDGSLRVTGGQVEVGSGTVRIQASGIDVGNGSIVNVATLVTAALSAPSVTDTVAGLAPASGGGTSNFLRADGSWSAPIGTPGSASGAIQFNTGAGTFGGYTGISILDDPIISNNARGIAFGNANAIRQAGINNGELRFATGFTMRVRTPSGGVTFPLSYTSGGLPSATGGTVSFGNSAEANGREAIKAINSDVASGGVFNWRTGGGTAMQLTPTALDVGPYHLHTKSISVVEKIANSELATVPSGTFKGSLTETQPTDITFPTLAAFIPTFTSTAVGLVPQSGGGTTNFLRADGSWSAPPGGSATPGEPDRAVQFNDGGAFAAASGIQIIGDGAASTQAGGGAALVFGQTASGPAPGGGIGTIRGPGELSLFGLNASGINVRMVRLSGTGVAGVATRAVIQYGTITSDRLHKQHWNVGTGGAFSWQVGGPTEGTGTVAQLSTTGMDLTQFHLSAKTFALASGIGPDHYQPFGSGMFLGNLSGTGAPVPIAVATMHAFAPTFTATNPGTVPQSGGGTDNFLRADGTWTAPSGGHQFPPVAGATNLQLAQMSTGTVKANLTGNATPSDVPVNTLLAFAPTFTAAIQGVVPPSGGGTTNYLRADGTWAAPPGTAGNPGGGDTALQFYQAGSFGGATGLNARNNGQALGIGVPSFLPGAGDIRVASGFNITANLPSGIAGVAARQSLFDWSGGGASGVLKVGGASGIMGTVRSEVATGGAFEWLIGGQTGMRLGATALDASRFHITTKSLDTPSINGLPADANQLKRGLDIGSSSGLPSGLSLYLPRGAASGANRYIIPSGAVGTGTQAAPRFVTLSPTGGRGGAVIRIERVNDGGWPFEVRTPTGTVLHSFPSGAKGVADFVFSKPSGAVFENGGSGDLF